MQPPDSLPFDASPTVAADPHASKIAPDDPRLQLGPVGGRTLRKGPAIALAAGLLGALAAAVGVALQPSPSDPSTKPAADPAGSIQAPIVPESIRSQGPAADVASGRPGPSGTVSDSPSTPPFANGGAVAASDPQKEWRAEQDQKAVGAPILFDSTGAPELAVPTAHAPPSAQPSLAPSARAQTEADDDPNRQERKNAFVDSEGASHVTDVLADNVEHPRSAYEIKAGSIIPAVLITALNSDLPGPVVAQVRENVYDTATGNALLIPQGARLLANYDSMVIWGQQRVLVCWNRLVFPNGDSLDLRCMPAADLQGAAGLTDEVDEHWVRLVTGAALSSILAASAQALAGNQAGYAPTVPQLWANNGAQSVNQTGQQIVRRDMQIQPTITVRPGFSVNLLVNKDIVLGGPYTESGAGIRPAEGAADRLPSGQ